MARQFLLEGVLDFPEFARTALLHVLAIDAIIAVISLVLRVLEVFNHLHRMAPSAFQFRSVSFRFADDASFLQETGKILRDFFVAAYQAYPL
jgi:hypothetical protein